MVAGYIDGLYGPNHNALGSSVGWDTAGWNRFPNAIHVQIACFASTNNGVVLDVENFDATPAQAPGWVTMRRAAGVDPTVYTSYDNWQAVRNAFIAAKVVEPHYWIADYDNVATIFSGAIAKQYANSVYTKGDFDLSIVADVWPGVDMTRTEIVSVIRAYLRNADPTNYTDANLNKYADIGVAQGLDAAMVQIIAAFPPVASAGATMAQVNSAIATAIAAIPPDTDTPGVTMDQVNSAIQAAIAALPQSKAPSLWDILRNTVWPN